MRRIFAQERSPEIKGIVIWLPMIASDDKRAAETEFDANGNDARLICGWDEKREVSTAFQKSLYLSKPAWDVYLVYRKGRTWDGTDPPQPDFWMHQLNSDPAAPHGKFLDAKLLRESIASFLSSSYRP